MTRYWVGGAKRFRVIRYESGYMICNCKKFRRKKNCQHCDRMRAARVVEDSKRIIIREETQGKQLVHQEYWWVKDKRNSYGRGYVKVAVVESGKFFCQCSECDFRDIVEDCEHVRKVKTHIETLGEKFNEFQKKRRIRVRK